MLRDDKPAIEFWFEFGSNYSYPSVMRIEALAARNGIAILWKPFLLGPIFKEFGWNTSPFVLQKEKGRYMWRDMERQCEKFGLRWTRPSTFPRAAVLPMRVAVLGAAQPWMAAYCRATMLQNFAEDLDIATHDNVHRVLGDLGLPATELIAAAQEEDNKQLLRANTERARARGIFGAPTFFVADEMFWGNDRLDDTLEYAARSAR